MIFIILTIITFFFISQSKRRPNVKIPSLLLVGCYIMVFAMRSMNVADTPVYYDTYIGDYVSFMEEGYMYLNDMFHDAGFSFRYLLLFISFFDFVIWYTCTRKILHQDNLLVALAIFMSNMGLLYYGIVLRSGMANAIMYIPICYLLLLLEKDGSRLSIRTFFQVKKYIRIIAFVLFLYFAGLFHQSIYVVVLALLLFYIPLNNKLRYAFIIFGLVVGNIPQVTSALTHFTQSILSANNVRMANRFDGDIQIGLSYYQIITALVGFVYIKMADFMTEGFRCRQYKFILDLYCVGFLISGLFSFMIAGARLGHLLIFYEFIMPALLVIDQKNNKKLSWYYLAIFIIVILNLIKNLFSTRSLFDYIEF